MDRELKKIAEQVKSLRQQIKTQDRQTRLKIIALENRIEEFNRTHPIKTHPKQKEQGFGRDAKHPPALPGAPRD